MFASYVILLTINLEQLIAEIHNDISLTEKVLDKPEFRDFANDEIFKPKPLVPIPL